MREVGRLLGVASQGETLGRVLLTDVPDLRGKVPEITDEVAHAIAKSLQRRPEDRFATALDFAHALEAGGPVTARADVARWVKELAGSEIEARARVVAEIEGDSQSPAPRPRRPPKARNILVAFVAFVTLTGLVVG